MAHDENSKANDPFEEMLRSLRPTAPLNAETTFYEAGRLAALCEIRNSETHRWKRQSFPAFASGMVAGLVAAFVVFAGFLATTTSSRTDQVQQAVVPTPNETTSTNALVANAKSRDSTGIGLESLVTRGREPASSRLVVVDWLSGWIGKSNDTQPISPQKSTLVSHTHPYFPNYLVEPNRPFVPNGTADTEADSYKVLRYQPLKPDTISDFL